MSHARCWARREGAAAVLDDHVAGQVRQRLLDAAVGGDAQAGLLPMALDPKSPRIDGRSRRGRSRRRRTGSRTMARARDSSCRRRSGTAAVLPSKNIGVAVRTRASTSCRSWAMSSRSRASRGLKLVGGRSSGPGGTSRAGRAVHVHAGGAPAWGPSPSIRFAACARDPQPVSVQPPWRWVRAATPAHPPTAAPSPGTCSRRRPRRPGRAAPAGRSRGCGCAPGTSPSRGSRPRRGRWRST